MPADNGASRVGDVVEPIPLQNEDGVANGGEVRLSVVIPCHNVQAYLDDCVRSLQANLDDGYEFIFVDDASTDRTHELLEQAIGRLPGARLLHHDHNQGLAAARNTGLDAAGGRYVTFLDSDDLVVRGYYPALVSAIARLGVDFVRTDHLRFTGTKRSIDRIQFGPRMQALEPRTGILPANRNTSVDYPFAWAGIFNRRLIDNGLLYFDPELRTCEDRPWIWRLHLQAESMAVVGLLGVLYRRDIKGSLSQVTDDRQFDFIPAFDQILTDARADRDAERFLPKAIRSYCAIMYHQLSRLDQYQSQLATQLTRRCAEAISRIPRSELRPVMAGLDRDRAKRINQLLKAA